MLMLCLPAAGQPVPALDPPAIVRTLAASDDRVSIPIHIGGRGPWNFIVDTGSQRTVISRNLADQLALPARRPVTIVSMAGRSEARTVALPRLGYGKEMIDDIEAPVLEADHLGAAGLLGLDSLHAKRLLLNFRTGRMEIGASRPSWRDPNAIIVEARRRKGQLILLHSDANGLKVNIILDTGTHLSVGNLALRDKLIRKKRAPSMSEVSLISVTGETLTGQLGRIGKIRMGPISLTDLPVMFADAQPFRELGLADKPTLLLGIQALKMFDRVAIDFGRGKIDFLMPGASALDRQRLASTG
ncbi:retroviral-like aspartic protease family protein [Sphingobium sp. MAH-33]|uniref:Retroviral-like aspartic protease family protein n=2 Tax=Sphingomonadaceae TaxID=41297 RepID=A0ABT0DYH4_9SPHN|nr:retroviral-like aspartic protease family protein [Sphingobium agri]MCK0532172.1 retroviral-like aspartic protease family protein [Sphingobium agri]